MPFESIESLTSFLFDDVEPIITTQEEREKYDEIFLDFQRCLEPEPITSFGEANATTPSGAVPKEAEPMATSGEPNTSIGNTVGETIEQPREEDEPDIPTSPSEAITTQPAKTRPSKKGRKKHTEESQRPDWLPEGWTSRVEVRRNGASAGGGLLLHK